MLKSKWLVVVGLLLAFGGGYLMRGCKEPSADARVAELEKQVEVANKTIADKELANQILLSKNKELESSIVVVEANVEKDKTQISSLTARIEALKKTATTLEEKDEIIAAQDERFSLAMRIMDEKDIIISHERIKYDNLMVAYDNRGVALQQTKDAMNLGLNTSRDLASENKKLKRLLKIGGVGVAGYVTWKLLIQPILR